jgi:hypothetical protein
MKVIRLVSDQILGWPGIPTRLVLKIAVSLIPLRRIGSAFAMADRHLQIG